MDLTNQLESCLCTLTTDKLNEDSHRGLDKEDEDGVGRRWSSSQMF